MMGAEVLSYEELVQAYESALVTHLRGQRTDVAFLDMWVPDEDPVRSILNMAEAAGASGQDAFAVRVRQATLPGSRIGELHAALSSLGDVEVTSGGEAATVHIRNLRRQ